ncbi:MAG: hypothetical protein RL297_2202 [Pseudomonadota bacterium]|jgi:hypothetical protein
MKPQHSLSEQAFQSLEASIPKMAQAAFSQAQLNALTISGKVLQVTNGQLVELNAEGSVRVIKDMLPRFKVQAGVKRTRKASKP